MKRELTELCEIPLNQYWELKYRASRDGFDSKDFHRSCDNIANTLTVINSTSGNIFGGYTEKPWSSNGGGVKDPHAFVFSLINKDDKPFKVKCSNNAYAILCHSDCGPSFVEDITVETNSHINRDSYTDFGCSYEHPEYTYDTEEARNILAGSFNFQTVDIEVFSKLE
jgi:hypothetical protein